MRTIEAILQDMQTIMDAATGRTMTPEELSRYEALEAERQTVEQSEQARARHAAYNTATGGRPVDGGPALVPDLKAKQTYDAAFLNYMRTGKVNADLERGPVLTNAQSEGTPSEGGYLVPQLFREKLVERLKAFGGIGSLAERYTTGNGNPVEWPTVDDTSNVGEIVSEGGTFSAGADLGFGTNALTSYSYATGGSGATPIRVSRELAQDSAFNIEGLLARLLGLRIGRIQAVHLATGSGVAQPLGLVTGRTPVQAAANTGFTWKDFLHWKHSLDPAYRVKGECYWVMNDATLELAEALLNAAGDPLLIAGGIGTQQADSDVTYIHGYPVKVDQAMPTYVANSPTTNAIAFGNIAAGYVVRDVKSVELLVDPYGRIHNRQIQYSAWARMDATQQDTNAYIVAAGH